MSSLTDLSAIEAALLVAAWLGVAALLLWLSWRKPTWVLFLALLSIAVRPQLLWGGEQLDHHWEIHQWFVVYALALNAMRYGMRLTINWPIAALCIVLALNLALGDLNPKLSLGVMLASLVVLCLPWSFTQVVLEPGSRRLLAFAIALAAPFSIALGSLLEALGLTSLWGGDRLQGATGNAAVFATLAFAGFVTALHEATRPGRWYALPLAAFNLVLTILSGTRMALFAALVFLATYAIRSEALRQHLRQQRLTAAAAAVAVAPPAAVIGALIYYGPTLYWRMFGGAEDPEIQLSARDLLWSFYWDEFLLSPLVGRGLGAGFVAAQDWTSVILATVHNEYLHLLVIGGVLGAALCLVAIGLWCRQLLLAASPNDQDFLVALGLSMAVYATTENLLLYSTALPIFAYLGVLLTRPAVGPVPDWVLERARADLGPVPAPAAPTAAIPMPPPREERAARLFGARSTS